MKGFQSTATKTTLLFVAFVGVCATGTVASAKTATVSQLSSPSLQQPLATDLISAKKLVLDPPPGNGTPKPENTRAVFQHI